MSYNIEGFLRSIVDRYREVTRVHYTRRASHPFLRESAQPDFTYKEASVEPPHEADVRSAHDHMAASCHDATAGGEGSPPLEPPGLGGAKERRVPKQLRPYMRISTDRHQMG